MTARLARRGQPGRRGFGGAADAAEAAALRQATRGDHDLNPGMTPPSVALRPAAVLVPLVDRPEGMSVLLTQRTAHLSAHAGQIAFPGGRLEPEDPDAAAAALRETEEEVGLPRDRVTLIGRLDTYVTGTGFEITPVVGIVSLPFSLRSTRSRWPTCSRCRCPLCSIRATIAAPSGFLRAPPGLFCPALRGPQHLGRHRRHAGQPRRGAGRLRTPWSGFF